MPLRRYYADHGDGCMAAYGFDVVGDRWAVIVLRELLLGPKRFNELMAGAAGVTPTVLATRLRQLEFAGVVEQVTLPPPARLTAYQLTAWGQAFEPVLQAMGRWAQNSPAPPSGGMTPDAVILAMRTMAHGPGPRPPVSFDLALHDSRTPAATQAVFHLSWSDQFRADKRTDAAVVTEAVSFDSSRWAQLLFDPSPEGVAQVRTLTGPTASATHHVRSLVRHFRQVVRP